MAGDRTVAECHECGNYEEVRAQGGKLCCWCTYCNSLWNPSSGQLRRESDVLAEQERIMRELEEDQKRQRDLLAWAARNPEAAEALLAGTHAVVPAEPTEDMWTAGRNPLLYRDAGHFDKAYIAKIKPVWFSPEIDGTSGHTAKGDTAVWVWRAMLAAGRLDRPQPTAPAETEGDGV